MRKCLFALVAMVASSAMAQQNVDITAEQFKSGAANSQLTSLGRDAAASGKRLVVTAPQHWHAQIASSIRAGGNAEIVLKDGFYETLLVRVEDKKTEPAIVESKPEPKPEAKPERIAETPKAPPTPAPIVKKPEPAVVNLPPPVQAVVKAPTPAPTPEPVAQAPAPTEQVVAPAPAVEEKVAAPATATEAAVNPTGSQVFVAAEPGDVSPLRASMEERFNRGRRIVERVQPNELRRLDVIHTDKGAAVVVRLESNQSIRMWLVGSINLHQTAIGNEGPNKYRVLQTNLK